MSLLAGCQANEEKASKKPGKSSWILDLARDGRSAKLPIYKNDDSDSLVIAHGFSWGPKPLGSLSNITYLKECGDLFRLKPVTLHMWVKSSRYLVGNKTINPSTENVQELCL